MGSDASVAQPMRDDRPGPRRFRDFRYRTVTSWSRSRRVVGKAEVLAGRRDRNPQFVVTSLTRQQIGNRELYEDLCCARGDMENRTKEQQLDLFAQVVLALRRAATARSP